MTIQIRGEEFKTASEAIQWANASGRGEVITVARRYLVVEQTEADRIASLGIEFAYVCDHEMPDGSHRLMTIPVN